MMQRLLDFYRARRDENAASHLLKQYEGQMIPSYITSPSLKNPQATVILFSCISHHFELERRLAEVTTAFANVSVITFPPPKFVIQPSTFSLNRNECSRGTWCDIFMVSKHPFCAVKKKRSTLKLQCMLHECIEKISFFFTIDGYIKVKKQHNNFFGTQV